MEQKKKGFFYLSMVKGILWSSPPIILKPHAVVNSRRTNWASKIKSDILFSHRQGTSFTTNSSRRLDSVLSSLDFFQSPISSLKTSWKSIVVSGRLVSSIRSIRTLQWLLFIQSLRCWHDNSVCHWTFRVGEIDLWIQIESKDAKSNRNHCLLSYRWTSFISLNFFHFVRGNAKMDLVV